MLSLVKKRDKAVCRKILKIESNFVSDILQVRNLKQAAVNRAYETGSNLLRKMATSPGKRKRPAERKKKNSSKAKRQKQDSQYLVKNG